MFRTFTLLCCALLSGCFHTTMTTKEVTEKDVAELCSGVAAAVGADGQAQRFKIDRQGVVDDCLANPRLTNLWAQASDASAEEQKQATRKRRAYCELSPTFRICFVCNRLASKRLGADAAPDPNHNQDYQACEGLLSSADQRYAKQIWPAY
jgi:hypothetical protein